LRLKKNIKAFIQKSESEAAARVEATIAKAKRKQDDHDEQIAKAKRALLEARRLAGGVVYGDVSSYAKKYDVKYRELRTALDTVGRGVRSKRGRPSSIQESQKFFLVKEIEARAIKSRSMPKAAVTSVMAAMAESNNTPFSSQEGVSKQPSKRTMDKFCKQRGLFTVTANETEKARLDGVSKKIIGSFFHRYKEKVLNPNPALLQRRAHVNLDETPTGGRGEKLNRRLCALVTKNVLKKKKGGSIRTQAIADSSEVMSFIPITLADATVLAKVFLVAAGKVNPKWTAPPPQKLKCGFEFLPRMPLDYFTKGDVVVYATPSGVMNTETFEKMIKDVVVPRHRMIVPEGPICIHMDAPEQHTMSKDLASFLKANGVISNFFPHKTSTVLQPLDLYFNKMWRAKYREYIDALITVGQNTHAYLDDRLQARFMTQKRK
jgi:ribosomal protein L17